MKRRERRAPLSAAALTLLPLAVACFNLNAALLVTDGGTTNRTTGISLLPADLVVGTNAGNTTVNILGPNGAVSNASGHIGFNASSSTNKVTVQNSGAVWNNTGWLYVGNSGSRNSLIVSNAGKAFSSGGVIGSGGSNNQAIVTGSGSSWNITSFELDIGGAGSGNALLIANGGAVTNGIGSIGYQSGANSNQVTVTDSGSVWKLNDELSVGEVGAGNTLVVTNGGVVSGTSGYLGRYSDGNRMIVTGPNSTINLTGILWPGGVTGAGNTLLITNGGRVANDNGWIGSGGSSNQVAVTGNGSSWTNASELVVGGTGASGNQLTVETNSAVSCGTDTIIGQYSGAGNVLKLTGGTLAVGGALDVRRGTLQLDSGTATATTLWATNGANSSVVFHGGTLVTRGGAINNGSAFSVGHNSGYPAATWVVLSNATPTISGYLNVGSNAVNASLLLTNGGTLSTSGGQIGVNFGSGSVTVSGANSTWNNNGPLWVAQNASGSSLLIANGGTVSNTHCNLGYQGPGNAVTVSGANSVWNNGGLLTIGLGGGSGSLLVNSGASASANGMIVGGGSSANIRATVDGGTLRVTNGAVSAALDIRRGTNVLNAGLIEADQLLMTNVAGSFTFNGGTLITRGGTINNGQDFVVGANTGFAPATWDLRNNAITTVLANGLDFGSNTANATLLITNGATLSVGALTVNPAFSTRIGNNAVATNTLVVVSGVGSVWSNSAVLLLGRAGSFNTLLITNGGKVLNGDGVIGLIAGATSNQVTVSGAGSLWNNSTELQVGRSGSGSQLYVASGGSVTASNTFVGFDVASGNNLLRVTGGTFTVTNILDVRRGTLRLDSGTITTAALFATNGLSGQIAFNGGTLSVSNATVNNGAALAVGNGSTLTILQLLGNGLHTFANGLVVPVNGRLSGNGTVSGNLTAQANSVVYPGGSASLGRLVLSNSPALNGTVYVDISKNGAALTNDQIQVIAPLTYGGNLVVNKLGPTALASGDSIKLFIASNYAGAFNLVSLPILPTGLMWTNQLLLSGSLAVIPQTVPKISSVTQSGTNLVMKITGGAPGFDCFLYSTTNVALPMAAWQFVIYVPLDPQGQASITNAINFAQPQRYFRALVAQPGG